jgi:hypothetical protein
VVIWYIFPRFGILYQEKSGNPASELQIPTYAAFRYHSLLFFQSQQRLMFRWRCQQGDQIGRIFAYWAIVYLGQFFEN